jgi:hypothetical protein
MTVRAPATVRGPATVRAPTPVTAPAQVTTVAPAGAPSVLAQPPAPHGHGLDEPGAYDNADGAGCSWWS